MGVMECDRTDCENIMCKICIEGRWYVCNECAAEFRRQFGDEELPRAEIIQKFSQFMQTPKLCSNESEPMSVQEFIYGPDEAKEEE